MTLEKILWESWLVLGQMAPYLLFGFLVAGILSVCVSPEWVERNLGRRGLGSVLKASLFGVPLPLCSCGVIPVSASIRRHGASRSATTAFLLSTPQTGVDSIAITYGLLGPVFAVFRPIAALLTGLLGGGLVQMFDEPQGPDDAAKPDAPTCDGPCCAGGPSEHLVLRVFRYGFVVLPRDIGGALLVGVLVAGAITALVEPNYLAQHVGKGPLSSLLMILATMAASVPIYVCATASVPIALGFIHAGVSPGAALAFLIAGPATNAATLTVVWRLLGRRTALLYLVTVALSAVACGLLLDGLFPDLTVSAHYHLTSHGGWLRHVWAIALLCVLVISSKTVARLLKGREASEEATKGEAHTAGPAAGQRLDLKVTGMTCSHCAESVRRALAECDGVRSAQVSLASGRALVTGDDLDQEQLLAAVTDLGYAASLSEEGMT